jgi:hypothetical protein
MDELVFWTIAIPVIVAIGIVVLFADEKGK